MSKGCESATKTFLKCEEPSVNARFEVNWVEVVEPSGVQALKNPNPLKDVEALVVLVVAMLS